MKTIVYSTNKKWVTVDKIKLYYKEYRTAITNHEFNKLIHFILDWANKYSPVPLNGVIRNMAIETLKKSLFKEDNTISWGNDYQISIEYTTRNDKTKLPETEITLCHLDGEESKFELKEQKEQ